MDGAQLAEKEAASKAGPGEKENKAEKKKKKKGGGKGELGGAAAVEVATFAALAPQLRLLAVCSAHETVAAELCRLAHGEGATERVLYLLEPRVAADAVAVNAETLVGAAALLAALSGGARKAAR